ncbi:ATP-dependent protease LonB [Texcoconibacillus texcoconensis]|uniref:endopeptidase La n=1 Tax=Texcoconibacillus texcoconensis TaxID=1095777 RepID=A0A840QMP9_9BACI|nr:ATP-dependent protease LonB [Texcoconibacillus texcoconensis]MBB5172655.1 Lon-like ATP-dependent protease [Texcoconibacillus texcoconensis]
MNWTGLALLIQLFFGIVIGLYFWTMLRSQRNQRVSVDKESKKELYELRRLRDISLSAPLTEKVRPRTFDDIIGQEDGIRSLRAALCGPNPQHVIVYGPPGVGKTAAARLVLEESKKEESSPFRSSSVFVELDGATARFDERGIADPLIGSVHDPIYQGAGAMGQAGIPQPKQGAVTKAHGGVLFIDEIGELHGIQLNKLLKVLEDRKVFLESAYYSEENRQIPDHVHDIFQNGLPADFRLIGATTRRPEEIPPAIRSRCLEVYFRALTRSEVEEIASSTAKKLSIDIDERVYSFISKYATNGREAVNMMQIAAGVADGEGRSRIELRDMEWVVNASQRAPRPEKSIIKNNQVGFVNGLAVFGPNLGSVLEVEVTVFSNRGNGDVTVTGIAEEEEVGGHGRSYRRKSMAKGSVENVVTVLKHMGIPTFDYDIHVNFPGGIPVDGPSAGVSIATAIYSAIHNISVSWDVAMTGELSIHGTVKPVGGIIAKVEAAKQAGAKRILIPKENDQSILREIDGVTVHPVEHFHEVLEASLIEEPKHEESVTANDDLAGGFSNEKTPV